ncbi:MAG: hypothetical protein JWN01_261 [Patescibacteria group bacterium]|nr:hypothetical protein [Patescibacteria group bacterium]
MNNYVFDWSDMAFQSKKPLNELKATFIAAPREISVKRFTQLIKTYLPRGNIILGLAKEDYIAGFEGQPQFRTLQAATVQPIIDKVNASSGKHTIAALSYAQRETKYILEKLALQRVVLINGSWKQAFHTTENYYTLINRHIPYEMISPFTDEAEAREYEARVMPEMLALIAPKTGETHSEAEMLALAGDTAKLSFDYSFQTGVTLGRAAKAAGTYEYLAAAFNRVVPFQTYAMHYGASRETNFSPPHDLNHYDTVHAEVEMIIKAQKEGIDLRGATLFINLLPCPACARMFTETDIAEFVYSVDHSEGYAVQMLERAGKVVRRVVAQG